MNLIEALEADCPVEWQCPLYGWTDQWKFESIDTLISGRFRKNPKKLSDEPWPDVDWITHLFMTRDGKVWGSNMHPKKIGGLEDKLNFTYRFIGSGFDTTDWENSIREKPKRNPEIALERWEGKRIVYLPDGTNPITGCKVPHHIDEQGNLQEEHELPWEFLNMSNLDDWRELTEAENFLVDYKGVKMTHPSYLAEGPYYLIPDRIHDGSVYSECGAKLVLPLSEYVPYDLDWSTHEFWRQCYG
jgi:hypothetical protein